jgi:hypothetical protein
MRKILSVFTASFIVVSAFAQQQMKPEETEDWSRKPQMVTPGGCNQPPSDAIILYLSAEDINKWQDAKGNPAMWKAEDSKL